MLEQVDFGKKGGLRKDGKNTLIRNYKITIQLKKKQPQVAEVKKRKLQKKKNLLRSKVPGDYGIFLQYQGENGIQKSTFIISRRYGDGKLLTDFLKSIFIPKD